MNVIFLDKLYELVVEGTLSNLRVTPLFLDSDIYNRLDIGVFGDVYYPHPPLPCVRYNCTMVVMADRIYIIGGSSSPLLADYTYRSKGSKTVYCLNFSKVHFYASLLTVFIVLSFYKFLMIRFN